MERFIVAVKERWDSDMYFLEREYPTETLAIDWAVRFFREGSLNATRVFNQDIKIVFKQDRQCSCKHVQQEFDFDRGVFVDRCQDCKVVVDESRWSDYMERMNIVQV
jgi:hypothetical protein